MKFNSNQSKILHSGENNPTVLYYKDANELKSSGVEKDLGVLVDHKFKFDQHINETVKKSNTMVGNGMIIHYISFKTDIMVPLFKTLIRHFLEYAHVVLCPNIKKHDLLIENVQRRFTKRIIGLKNLNYEDKLKSLNLPSLEFRWTKADMIETYSIRLYMDYVIYLVLPLFSH